MPADRVALRAGLLELPDAHELIDRLSAPRSISAWSRWSAPKPLELLAVLVGVTDGGAALFADGSVEVAGKGEAALGCQRGEMILSVGECGDLWAEKGTLAALLKSASVTRLGPLAGGRLGERRLVARWHGRDTLIRTRGLFVQRTPVGRPLGAGGLGATRCAALRRTCLRGGRRGSQPGVEQHQQHERQQRQAQRRPARGRTLRMLEVEREGGVPAHAVLRRVRGPARGTRRRGGLLPVERLDPHPEDRQSGPPARIRRVLFAGAEPLPAGFQLAASPAQPVIFAIPRSLAMSSIGSPRASRASTTASSGGSAATSSLCIATISTAMSMSSADGANARSSLSGGALSCSAGSPRRRRSACRYRPARRRVTVRSQGRTAPVTRPRPIARHRTTKAACATSSTASSPTPKAAATPHAYAQ